MSSLAPALQRMSASLVLLLSLAAPVAAATVHVTDDRGARIAFDRPPQRIVTLLPSLTELVCALDACARLVGVDTFSNWPARVAALPRVGGLDDANIEAIVALRPDVVLAAQSTRAVPRLEALGLKVVALEPRSFADLQRVLGVLAPVLAARDAAAVWREIDQGVEAAARELPPALRGTRVYFEVNSAPYAASESSFIGELLARIGVVNVVPGTLGPFPKLNPEFVVRADPQVIMVSDRQATSLRARPGWDRIRAVRDGRLCLFTPRQGDALVRPGPRMPEAAALMVRCLQGRLSAEGP